MRPRAPRADSRLLAALESVGRQEILVALEASPELTVAEIARQLGRRPDALYHHLKALQRTGVIACSPRQGARGRPATAWRLLTKRIALARSGLGRRDARHAERVAAGLLRSANRDFRGALAASFSGEAAFPAASRRKVWLSAAERNAARESLREFSDRLAAHGPGRGREPYVLTLIFAQVFPQESPDPPVKRVPRSDRP